MHLQSVVHIDVPSFQPPPLPTQPMRILGKSPQKRRTIGGGMFIGWEKRAVGCLQASCWPGPPMREGGSPWPQETPWVNASHKSSPILPSVVHPDAPPPPLPSGASVHLLLAVLLLAGVALAVGVHERVVERLLHRRPVGRVAPRAQRRGGDPRHGQPVPTHASSKSLPPPSHFPSTPIGVPSNPPPPTSNPNS